MSSKCDRDNTDFDSSKIRQSIEELKKIDFELAYLIVLTFEGLKPLSRWEKPLTLNAIKLIQQMDLRTKQVHRSVKSGKETVETIFSRTHAYIQLYEQRFANAPVDKSTQTQRFEGFLFGYPPCCIENYIHKPYAPNNLTDQNQKILFHWACKDCKIIPELLHAYKSVYDTLSNY